LAIFSSDLTLEGNLFQRVDAATGRKRHGRNISLYSSKSELDGQSWIGFRTGVSGIYINCLLKSSYSDLLCVPKVNTNTGPSLFLNWTPSYNLAKQF